MDTKNNLISEINMWAMRDGIWLGLVGVLTLASWRMGIVNGTGDLPFLTLLACGPVASVCLTMRYRREVAGNGGFSFPRGFTHALFTGFYASLWVALTLFLYLQYFDHGTVFSAYAAMVCAPETADMMRQISPEWADVIDTMSDGRGAEGLADTFQSIGAATYATMPIYAAFIAGPVISTVTGLVCKRRCY